MDSASPVNCSSRVDGDCNHVPLTKPFQSPLQMRQKRGAEGAEPENQTSHNFQICAFTMTLHWPHWLPTAQENRRFSIHRPGSPAFKLRYALRMTNFTLSVGHDGHENVMDFRLTSIHFNASYKGDI